MRALTLTEGRRLEVRDVPDPEAAPGQVVVRVAACGICGSDLHMVEAGLLEPGTILGHEASGTIAEVGDGVEHVRAGDPVAIYPFEPCGSCDACASGATARCRIALGTTIGLGLRPGGFAERVTVSASMLRPLPTALPVELGALAEPLAVALHGLRRSRIGHGVTVGVVGCGPIGLCAILAAKAMGAGRVWASDPNAFRADLALRAGADEAGATVREADVVVECAGARGTLDTAVGAARGGGQVVLLAVNVKGDEVYPFSWVVKEVDVVPGFGYTRDEYDEAARLIASGSVDVAPIVTRRVGLDDADEAFFALLGGAPEGKVLVVPSG